MDLAEWKPQSKLVTKVTQVLTPKFPVVDAHNHLGPFAGNYAERDPGILFDALDVAGVQCYFDLDGGWGEDILRQRLDVFKARAPERIVTFAGVNWSQFQARGDGFGEWAADRLREQARWGAQGLKIWKNFGLLERDQHGALLAVNDRRLDPVWQTAGELNLPVVIHVADPVAFFDPVDAQNERWDELGAHPDWQFTAPPYPSFDALLAQFADIVTRHPGTQFIGAHVGCYAENLGWVSALLDRCPNFYVDISARIGELGRQPYTARRFFERYTDRILFGTDSGPDLATYQLYYRFLETDDEYFNYNGAVAVPTQGRWMVYGLQLADHILRAIYADNARRLFRL